MARMALPAKRRTIEVGKDPDVHGISRPYQDRFSRACASREQADLDAQTSREVPRHGELRILISAHRAKPPTDARVADGGESSVVEVLVSHEHLDLIGTATVRKRVTVRRSTCCEASTRGKRERAREEPPCGARDTGRAPPSDQDPICPDAIGVVHVEEVGCHR